MIYALIILVCLMIFIPLFFMIWTAHSIRKAVGSKCFVITRRKTGDVTFDLCPADDLSVEVDKGDGNKGDVMLEEGVTGNVLYPPGGAWPPKFLRATVRCIIMAEGRGRAWNPWAKNESTTLGDEQLHELKKQTTVRALLQKTKAFLSPIEQGKLKLIWVYVILIAVAVIGIVNIVLAAMGYSNTNDIMRGFGLK